ncbi:MAG: ATP-dependent DNA helicase RecG, partial [Clostridia bacterium]|nr:ATP-dependent DNA helicase RecG [Clostridia bacterium]
MTIRPEDGIETLKGVGEARAAAFRKAGVKTVQDLIFRFPVAWRSGKISPLSPDLAGVYAGFELTVSTAPQVSFYPGGRRAFKFTAEDDAGTKVIVLYFHQPYLKNQIFKGDRFFFFGSLREKKGKLYLFSPERQTDRPDPDELTPLYASLPGLSSKTISKLVGACLVPCLPAICDPLPERIRASEDLPTLSHAVFTMHRPESAEALERAKTRLAFDRLFRFSVQASLFTRRVSGRRVPGMKRVPLEDFARLLPYPLTGAQKRAIGEIWNDLSGGETVRPMNRLLQGDVGSGKTVVAAAGAFLAARNGKSTLIMAPTEILARQHFQNLSELFARSGIPVYLLTGSTTKKERGALYEKTTRREPYVLVGTHALFEDSALCENVSLTVIDEQHRFGVEQRNRLNDKGSGFHSLVMSATPIPRSLAMFLYADSAISVLDEMPPGRKPISTFYVGEDKKSRVYAFLKERVGQGEKAYVVCPLIEDEEGASPLQSAKEEWEALTSALPEIPAALLHGKMKPAEKEEIMATFKQGETSILVSTTVIEVGVDVPDATVMV